jgi:3-methylcrotonyl-CoA carboxylase alpha subunit
MLEAALALCRQERYRGAGTIEFIVDARAERFWFLEMNTRIQVEHPVTEMTTGLDLVGMQLQLAGSMALPIADQDGVPRSGHAIECRVYAERPAKNFLPSPGRLAALRFPADDIGVRIDAGVREGDTITPFYDPLIAKLIVHAPDRTAAIARMLDVLHAVEIAGVETNVAFLRRVVAHPAFGDGRVSTSFIEDHRAELI